jgi:hypothetical protein
MEAVYKSGGKVASTEQGLVLDKPSAVILKVAPEQIAKSTRVGNDLVLTLVDGKQIYVNGFFAPYAEEGRNDLVLEDQQGVLWWGQYGGAWEGFEFTEIESNESVAAWLPWLVGWVWGAGRVEWRERWRWQECQQSSGARRSQ